MKALDRRGTINALIIPLIVVALALVAALGFGFWAYNSRQDYKDHTDQKIAVAVQAAQQQTQTADAAKYAEEAKKPLDTYIGPAAFGNIIVKYPKTWSAYVIEGGNGSGTPVDGYFHPNYVPSANNQNNAFALRVQLIQQSYDQVMGQYTALAKSQKVSVAAYSLPKVPSVVGSRVEGQITQTKQGVAIVLPLRNMTLRIWTEANDFKSDFDNNVLSNLTFQP